MKIGIISDIHGDSAALRKVLDRYDNYYQVDLILCAGDLVGRGPKPEDVVRIIREREIITVRGNHDEWVYDLPPDQMNYLNNLPLDWRTHFAGCELFMCHGKPGNNIWGLYRDHTSDTLLNMMLSSLGVDVLITGHTHVPMYVQVDGGVVVNPGSLCTFTDARYSSHTYGVLNLPDRSFDLYDILGSPDKPLRWDDL